MKTRVLLISKVFLSHHPKAGKPTHFKEKILSGEKIHTLRDNINFWQPIIAEVIKGESELSIREWTATPYASPQSQFLRLDNDYQGVGYDVVNLENGNIYVNGLTNREIQKKVPKNDGLSEEDFWNWFGNENKQLIMIHFTNYKY